MRFTAGKIVGLVLGIVVFAVLGFGVDALRDPVRGSAPAFAAGTVALMAVWWFSEALPIAVTACMPLVLFPLFPAFQGGRADNLLAAAKPFVDPYVFLFAGGLCIAGAMQQWNLHRRVALTIMARVGGDPKHLLLGVLCATAFISLWISNTATAAMMMPIGLALVAQIEARAGSGKMWAFGGAIMLAIAYGANVGGIGTKIGTAPNMQFVGFLAQRGTDLTFLQFGLVGFGFVVLFLPIVWLVLWRNGRADAPRSLDQGGAIRAELSELGPMKRAEWIVLGVFLAAAALWIAAKPITDALSPHVTSFTLRSAHVEGAIAIFAGVGLLALRTGGRQVLEFSSLKSVPWSSLLLLGGSFAMAAGVQESGLAAIGARSLSGLHELGGLQQVLLATMAAVFLSAFASNTATIGILLPLLWSAASPEWAPTVLFAATIGCSCDFMLPAGTPPNAIVFGSGYLTIPRMMKVGFALDVLAVVIAALWCALVVPRIL